MDLNIQNNQPGVALGQSRDAGGIDYKRWAKVYKNTGGGR